MATKYFAANSLAGLFRSSTLVVDGDSTAGRFDSTYVSTSVKCPGDAANPTITTCSFSATGTVWIRFDVYFQGQNNGLPLLTVYNGATGVFRLLAQSGSNTFQAQYWNGSAWTNTGSTFTLSYNALLKLCVRIDLNSGFNLYSTGSSIASGTGWTGGGTTATSAAFQNPNAGNTAWFSQIMIADYDIRDSHILPAALNGNSVTNTGAASGVYTDVNEAVLDESTSISITTSGNKAGQTHAAITLPSGYSIAAAVINARGRVTGTITDGKVGIRSGGTNYSSAGLTYNAGYEPRTNIWSTDPATGVAFTQSGFNNAESYLEAV